MTARLIASSAPLDLALTEGGQADATQRLHALPLNRVMGRRGSERRVPAAGCRCPDQTSAARIPRPCSRRRSPFSAMRCRF
jgi:hypothetical protein